MLLVTEDELKIILERNLAEIAEEIEQLRADRKAASAQVARLQQIVCRYGDQIRMSNAADPGHQQEIDEAMQAYGPCANYVSLVDQYEGGSYD